LSELVFLTADLMASVAEDWTDVEGEKTSEALAADPRNAEESRSPIDVAESPDSITSSESPNSYDCGGATEIMGTLFGIEFVSNWTESRAIEVELSASESLTADLSVSSSEDLTDIEGETTSERRTVDSRNPEDAGITVGGTEATDLIRNSDSTNSPDSNGASEIVAALFGIERVSKSTELSTVDVGLSPVEFLTPDTDGFPESVKPNDAEFSAVARRPDSSTAVLPLIGPELSTADAGLRESESLKPVDIEFSESAKTVDAEYSAVAKTPDSSTAVLPLIGPELSTAEAGLRESESLKAVDIEFWESAKTTDAEF
jgi:hypothetical protein